MARVGLVGGVGGERRACCETARRRVEGLFVACRLTSKGASASAGWGRADTRRHSGYVYCNEETPLTFESHAFPEDMVNACRYPLPSSHKQRARELREHEHGSPHMEDLILSTWAGLHFFAMLVVAHKHTTTKEILLWMIPSEPPKALQASECSELLDPMRASCQIPAQH